MAPTELLSRALKLLVWGLGSKHSVLQGAMLSKHIMQIKSGMSQRGMLEFVPQPLLDELDTLATCS